MLIKTNYSGCLVGISPACGHVKFQTFFFGRIGETSAPVLKMKMPLATCCTSILIWFFLFCFAVRSAREGQGLPQVCHAWSWGKVRLGSSPLSMGAIIHCRLPRLLHLITDAVTCCDCTTRISRAIIYYTGRVTQFGPRGFQRTMNGPIHWQQSEKE